MDKIREKVREDVTLTVNAPLSSKNQPGAGGTGVAPPALRTQPNIPLPAGRCRLTSRNAARTHQFIVSDTGCGIPEEQRENIFKPFAEVKDLTQGDGLGCLSAR